MRGSIRRGRVDGTEKACLSLEREVTGKDKGKTADFHGPPSTGQ